MLQFLAAFVVAVIVIPLILSLPTIVIDYNGVINGSVFSFIRASAYFLPMGTIGVILGITLSLYVLRMIFAIIKAIRTIFIP